jgi:uncharacterized phage protein gp47/JayE
MSGVVATGFDRKTYEEISDEIKAELKRSIDPRLVLTNDTALGQIVDTCSNQLALAWEVLEECYHAFDPDNATGQRMVALAELTGTTRKAPTQGVVPVTVNLDAGTYAANTLIAHEDGNADNRWYNLNEIVSTGGNVAATFVSEAFGSNTEVASGKLTEIAETVVGWNSVTNTSDATPGDDEETIEELRIRREDELAAAGSATLRAIVAEVSAIDNVQDVVGFENTSDITVGVIGPHGIRIVVWDDASAADDDIAQAILDGRAAGIKSYGAESGTATDYDGSLKTEAFDRADELTVQINCVVSSATGVAAADVKQALLSGFGTVNDAQDASRKEIGQDVIYNALVSAPFTVDGVDDTTTFQIRFTGDAWGTSNLTVDTDEIATLALADITVTGDVS